MTEVAALLRAQYHEQAALCSLVAALIGIIGRAPGANIDDLIRTATNSVEKAEDCYESAGDMEGRTCQLEEIWDDEDKRHYLNCTACHFGELLHGLSEDSVEKYNARKLWSDVDYSGLKYCPFCGAMVCNERAESK